MPLHVSFKTVQLFSRDAILKLMEAVDDYFPPPQRALDKPFSLPVEDVFSIQGRGTVVTGRIEQGIVKTGEEVEIVGINPNIKSTVTGILTVPKELGSIPSLTAAVLCGGIKQAYLKQLNQKISHPYVYKPVWRQTCNDE